MDLRWLALLAAVGTAAACAPVPTVTRAAPAGSAWRRVESAHFVIRTDAPLPAVQPFVDRLEDVYQALSTTFFAGVPMPKVDVLLFAQEADFRALAPEGLTGFFIPDVGPWPDGWMVLSASGLQGEAAAAVAAHELAHRFLYALSDRVPTWLHEGFAKYVQALPVDGPWLSFQAGPIRSDRASPLPVERLFASSSADFFGASARAQYLTAWLVVRRLVDQPVPDPVAHWRRLVARAVLATTPRLQAAVVSDALGGLSLGDLDRAIRAGGAAGEPATPPFPPVYLDRLNRPALRTSPVAERDVAEVIAAIRARAGQ